MNSPLLQDIRDKLAGGLSNRPFQHLEKTIRAAIIHFLSKLDLVSREEFDVQSQVLLKTREKVELLVMRIDQLEAERRSKTQQQDASDAD